VLPEMTDNRAGTEIEIDVEGRWDALALWELLVHFDSGLLQQTQEKWVVHARVPGSDGEALASAMRAIEEWQAERGIDASVRIAAHSDENRPMAERSVSSPGDAAETGGWRWGTEPARAPRR
jgi:hypothetical protein